MNCPYCGAPIAAGAAFCPDCGAPIPQVTNPTQPTVPTKADGSPLSKRNYLLKAAPAKINLMAKVTIAVALACVLIIILAANSIVNTDFTNIPVLRWELGEDEIEVFEEYRDELVEEIDDLLDEDDDDLIEEFEDEYDIDIKKMQKVLKNLSLNNVVKILEMQDEDEDIIMAFHMLISFVTVSAIVSVAMVLLGTLFGQTWLVVVNYIFSILYYILLAGMGYFLLASVAYILLAVLLSKQNKEYKAYKKSVLAH